MSHSILSIVDPKSGEKGYLEYVAPDQPIRYLGYLICATLNWKPALDAFFCPGGRVRVGPGLLRYCGCILKRY
jgi:hypothetical protein